MTVELLSPIVPHVTEEMWAMLGNTHCLMETSWPSHREEALAVEKRLVVIQVNGKVRSRIEVPSDYSDEQIEAEAMSDDRLLRFVARKPIKRVIVIQRKLVNVVV